MSNFPLVLVRHGQSQWNLENRFTGWVDVELSSQGISEAKAAGQLLKEEGLTFTRAYTSVLKRAIKTLWVCLEELDQMWLPVERRWQLNERHYGQLQGLNKKETTDKYGEDKVFEWRRSFSTPPPFLDLNDPNHPQFDPRYKGINPNDLPKGESLELCLKRVLPLWEKELAPAILRGEKLLIAAHGNSLRALMMHIQSISTEAISSVNIPTGIPYILNLDSNLKAKEGKYLGDPEAAQKAAEAVASQAKA